MRKIGGRTLGQWLSAAFLLAYGGYWVLGGASWEPRGQEWGYRSFGVLCIFGAWCLIRPILWGRFVVYFVALITVASWVWITVLSIQHFTLEQFLISGTANLFTLVPMLASTRVAYSALQRGQA
jgi:hypothetical protein